MTTISAGHHHKLHHSVHHDLDLPPRKLHLTHDSMRYDDSLLRKFLPYNGGDDDDSDPYASDHFRMFEFKVRRCTRSRSHDWTDCPFAHPGEKARRRDPRRFHYSGTVCAEYRRGGCSKGDNCEFSHGVFECWLHPARYRTEACKDGKNCSRKICFFAHTARELRVLPFHSQKSSPENSSDAKFKSSGASAGTGNNSGHCCMYCHSMNSSPTSTLLGLSHLSPPLSPSSPHGFSPITRYRARVMNLEYNNALAELVNSLEAMNVNEHSINTKNMKWADVSYNAEDQQQFILSPSTPNLSDFMDDNKRSTNKLDNGWNCSDPDLGWVNDLLM